MIKVWHDPWLSSSRQLQPTGPPPEITSEMTVDGLLNAETQEWNQSLIQQICPDWMTLILSIKPSKLGAPDKRSWIHTRDGIYTTKSGYLATVEARNEDLNREQHGQPFNWNRGVWNLHTAPKIQLLIWKALKGALPVGEKLQARQINCNPMCKRCGKLESINHLIFHCDFAVNVWRAAPFAQQFDMRGSLDLEIDWLRIIAIPCVPPVGITSGSLAPWIVWSLWTARNNLIFNDKGLMAEEVLSRAIIAAREWLSAQRKEEKKAPDRLKPNTRENQGIIVQSDAAWDVVTQRAGLGWVIQRPEVSLRFQSSDPFVNSPLVAEGLALREAIRKCQELEIKHVRCQTDSAQLIKAVTSREEPTELYGIVADIHLDCNAFDSISFTWIPRARNQDADNLAKQALSHVAVFTTA